MRGRENAFQYRDESTGGSGGRKDEAFQGSPRAVERAVLFSTAVNPFHGGCGRPVLARTLLKRPALPGQSRQSSRNALALTPASPTGARRYGKGRSSGLSRTLARSSGRRRTPQWWSPRMPGPEGRAGLCGTITRRRACSTAVSAGDSSKRCLHAATRAEDGMNSGNPSVYTAMATLSQAGGTPPEGAETTWGLQRP